VGLGSANKLRQLTVEGQGDINLGNPVAFDIVYVYDPEVGATLSSMSAPQWFNQKAQLQLKYGQKLLVTSQDTVPFSVSKTVEMPKTANDAQIILLFANYIPEAGQVAANLTDYQKVHVVFTGEHYQLTGSDE
jgi:hypothetical protein